MFVQKKKKRKCFTCGRRFKSLKWYTLKKKEALGSGGGGYKGIDVRSRVSFIQSWKRKEHVKRATHEKILF